MRSFHSFQRCWLRWDGMGWDAAPPLKSPPEVFPFAPAGGRRNSGAFSACAGGGAGPGRWRATRMRGSGWRSHHGVERASERAGGERRGRHGHSGGGAMRPGQGHRE